MKSTLHILICLLLLHSNVIFSAPEQISAPLEKVSLQLKWLHAFQFAGYYAAKEKGFYAAEGLDVDIKERIPHINNIEQVLKGESDYGIADSNLLLDRLLGKPVVVLASIFQHNALVYVSLKSSGIVSPYEFKGKRIMDDGNVNSSVDALLQAMRYEVGIANRDFTRIEHSFNPDDLINGKIDVMTVYLTNEIYYYREKHVDINIIDPRNYGIDFLGDNLFTTEQQIREHPERTQRFLRATLKGWDYALKHSEEIIQLILRNYNTDQRLTAERLRSEAVETAKMILPESIPLGSSSIKRFQRIAEIYQQLGLVKSLDGLDGFIYQEAAATHLNLSQEEKNWLQVHPVIRLAIDKDFAPYEWIDEKGNYVGLTADYIHKVEQILGVKFVIEKDKSWAETLAMAKRGEVEVVSDVNQTPEREQYLNFTAPHASIPVIIVNEAENGFIGSLDNLYGKRIVVEQSYFMQERLRNEHPDIQLVIAKSTNDALAMVNSGAVDAYVGDAALVNYVIKKTGMVNLRFSGDTGYKSEHRMAVTKANPLLINLITKALDSIPNSEKQTIENRWMSLQIKQDTTVKTLVKYGSAALFVLFLIVVWNMSLQRQIRRRKQIEAALRESQSELSHYFEQPLIGMISCFIDKRTTHINQHFCDIVGYSKEEMQTLNWAEITHPDDLIIEQVYFNQMVCGEINSYQMEKRYTHKNGQWVYVHLAVDSVRDTQGQVDYLIGMVLDITERKLAEMELRNSEEQLKLVLEGGYLGFWDWNIITNKVDRNAIWAEMLGYSYEEIQQTAQQWADFVYPDDRERAWQSIYDLLEGKTTCHQQEYRMYHKDGSIRWILDHANIVQRDESGKPTRMSGTHSDITERKLAEIELRIAATVFESQEGMIITDTLGIILNVNHAFTLITGYSKEEVLEKTPRILSSGKHNKHFYNQLWQTVHNTGSWQGEIWDRRKNGEIYPQWLTITAVKSNDNGIISHYVATLVDITERKITEERIHQLAFYDPLTLLPNRRLLYERLKHGIEMSHRTGNLMAVLMLDLDEFKAVNDTFGHTAGDELLQQVAERLKVHLREMDTVARLGGDEFVVLIENVTQPEQVAHIANNIIHTLKQPFSLSKNHEAYIGTSIGIALHPQHGDTIETLMDNSDTALYHAKDKGRGCFAYFSDIS
ncbi:MAG: PAS domain S-box protein [Methylococcales bacterium]|nr:PAS domain S-box protein [Methylococcales bacterium]